MKLLLGLVVLLALGAGGFVVNEARKEVKFLCGNFGVGASNDSVLRQLGTGDFLRYSIYSSPQGSRIIVDSLYTATLYRCVIDLDANGKVIEAVAGF